MLHSDVMSVVLVNNERREKGGLPQCFYGISATKECLICFNLCLYCISTSVCSVWYVYWPVYEPIDEMPDDEVQHDAGKNVVTKGPFRRDFEHARLWTALELQGHSQDKLADRGDEAC